MIFVEFGSKGVEAQPNYCIDDPEQISLERGLEVLLLLAWWIPVFRRKDDLRWGLAHATQSESCASELLLFVRFSG